MFFKYLKVYNLEKQLDFFSEILQDAEPEPRQIPVWWTQSCPPWDMCLVKERAPHRRRCPNSVEVAARQRARRETSSLGGRSDQLTRVPSKSKILGYCVMHMG